MDRTKEQILNKSGISLPKSVERERERDDKSFMSAKIIKIAKNKFTLQTNVVYKGDNLEIMKSGVIPNCSLDLVYIDPPFCTQKKQSTKRKWSKKITFGSYDDKFAGGIESYSLWLKRRLEIIYKLLKDDGSLFLHLDYRAIHYAKIALDEIFGEGNKNRGSKYLVNEIIWCYRDKGGGRNPNYYKRKHETILWYSKDINKKFKIENGNLSDTTMKRYSYLLNEDGTLTHRKLKEKNPGVFEARKKDGRIPKNLDEVWLDKNNGGAMCDWWDDITPISNKGDKQEQKEPYVYITQKPIKLLKRIIKTATKEGDVIADFFCGCGVALTSANLLNRKWIGVDKQQSAINALRKHLSFHTRLKNISIIPNRDLKKKDIEKMKWPEYQDWAVRRLGGEPAKVKNNGPDGFMPDGSWIEVKKWKTSAGISSYRQVIDGLRKTGQAYIIAKSFSSGLQEKKAEILRKDGWILHLIPEEDLIRDLAS